MTRRILLEETELKSDVGESRFYDIDDVSFIRIKSEKIWVMKEIKTKVPEYFDDDTIKSPNKTIFVLLVLLMFFVWFSFQISVELYELKKIFNLLKDSLYYSKIEV